jgi:hypothetical protein
VYLSRRNGVSGTESSEGEVAIRSARGQPMMWVVRLPHPFEAITQSPWTILCFKRPDPPVTIRTEASVPASRRSRRAPFRYSLFLNTRESRRALTDPTATLLRGSQPPLSYLRLRSHDFRGKFAPLADTQRMDKPNRCRRIWRATRSCAVLSESRSRAACPAAAVYLSASHRPLVAALAIGDMVNTR